MITRVFSSEEEASRGEHASNETLKKQYNDKI
jgi:hypothetical protein